MKFLSKSTSVGIVVVIAIAVFVFTFVRATLYDPGSVENDVANSVSAPSQGGIVASTSAIPLSYPSRLEIPKLGIDAKIQFVGLGKNNSLGIPTNFSDVGWYKYGVLPGENGSAVIDGHVDNGLSLPGVFKHLENIQKGDDIYVVMKNGGMIHFVVIDKASYDYKDSGASSFLFTQDDASYIRLITCVGDWVPQDRTYNERLVVSAVLAK